MLKVPYLAIGRSEANKNYRVNKPLSKKPFAGTKRIKKEIKKNKNNLKKRTTRNSEI